MDAYLDSTGAMTNIFSKGAVKGNSISQIAFVGSRNNRQTVILVCKFNGKASIVGISNGTATVLSEDSFLVNTATKTQMSGPDVFYIGNTNGSVTKMTFVSDAPHVDAIVNTASGQPLTDGVAPNTWVSIVGTRLATTAAKDGNLPYSLGGAQVGIVSGGNGNGCRLMYASPEQINCLLPSELNGDSVELWVQTALGISPSVKLPVVLASPGFFQANGSAIVTEGSRVLEAGEPLVDGNVYAVWLTGLGNWDKPVQIKVGGSDAEVLYAGRSGTIYQINFRHHLVPGGKGPYTMQMELKVGEATTSASVTVQ